MAFTNAMLAMNEQVPSLNAEGDETQASSQGNAGDNTKAD